MLPKYPAGGRDGPSHRSFTTRRTEAVFDQVSRLLPVAVYNKRCGMLESTRRSNERDTVSLSSAGNDLFCCFSFVMFVFVPFSLL